MRSGRSAGELPWRSVRSCQHIFIPAIDRSGRERRISRSGLLDDWGLFEYYIPHSIGGKFRSGDENLLIMRMIARRDLTVAIGHGKTFLGAIAVWLAGSQEQKDALKAIIRKPGRVSLGLTERAHGSDLVATEVKATSTDDGFLLSGEKWLINNATRGKALSVLVKILGGKHNGTIAMLFVEKDKLPVGSYSHLPKNLTHGIRAADISGIAFHDSKVPVSAIIGRAHDGLLTVLKLLQVTRTGCLPLSLGAADTALRMTVDFAVTRQLYQTTVFSLPYARRQLVEAFADILISECVAPCVSRLFHVRPEQMSLASAVAKYFVPETLETTIENLSVVLGARHYLRAGHWDGMFQKILRDNAIVGLFDGSTAVNLTVICGELVARAQRLEKGSNEPLDEKLESIFCLFRELPEFDLSRLVLSNRGIDDVLDALPQVPARLSRMREQKQIDDRCHAALTPLVEAFLRELSQQNRSILVDPEKARGAHTPPELFEAAKRYCVFYTASACIHFWIYNQRGLGEFAARPDWLLVCLTRLLRVFRPMQPECSAPTVEAMEQEMLRLHSQNRLFSLFPVQLAKPAG